jgi:hypothetical protein
MDMVLEYGPKEQTRVSDRRIWGEEPNPSAKVRNRKRVIEVHGIDQMNSDQPQTVTKEEIPARIR